jgi:DNA-binding transcriptional LysR family regulator
MNDRPLQARATAISFRQLRLFESVGRLSSVRRGSDECNLSQPAVTQAIGKLELQLGDILFERRTSGSYLTPAGRMLHVRVQRSFAQMKTAVRELCKCDEAQAAAIVNHISRPQVRCFLAIIDQGTFPRAAKALGLTQASLQRAARELEANLKTALYFRSAAGVMVSPDGSEFGRKLRLATQEIEWGIRDIEVARGAESSHIVIGALPFGGTVMLAAVLDDFLAAHPTADVRIVTEGAAEMRKRLRSGDVDLTLGLVQETTAHDLRSENLIETPYRIVGRQDHPLSRKRSISVEDLARYDWVVGAEGASRRACFDALFSGRVKPRAPIATSTLPIIRQLLASSDRLTMMTTYELMNDSGGLVALPFGPLDPCPSIGVTLRADWLPTRLHTDFIALLRQRAAHASLPITVRATKSRAASLVH